jgi:copper chaperone CopZ
MKHWIATLILFFGIAMTSVAQSSATQKAVIQTPGVHCEYCKKRIENYVGRQYGISSVLVDLKAKTTTVTWIKDRANIEDVKTHIANVGYDADDVEAEESMYHRLPKACQTKPVEN